MHLLDRQDAGRRLAGALDHLRGQDLAVLGLPRGGVPVAAQVAAALDAPLDVIMVRKLGVPFQPELAMGAIGEDGVRVLDQGILDAAGITDTELEAVRNRETAELNRRAGLYRHGRDRIDLRGRTAIVIDDGLATGSTARAACQVARAHGAAHVVLAVPVAPRGWTDRLADVADEFVCPNTPSDFRAIGQFYRDFGQTTDQEVIDYLDEAARRTHEHRQADSPAPQPAGTAARGSSAVGTSDREVGISDPEVRTSDQEVGTSDQEVGISDQEVLVQAGSVALEGSLAVPDGATGIVVFAHGSGSSRHSPRNQFVAEALNRAGLATLLFDLLTPEEEHRRANVFDTALLAGRLDAATRWLQEQPEARRLSLGCFGASTGAAAALWACTEPDSPIAAVVSRGGRPDLAAERLPAVTAPTLLVVGGADDAVLELNRQAAALLGGPNHLAIVPGATHLFSEPGALEQVAQLAADWFTEHLGESPSDRVPSDG